MTACSPLRSESWPSCDALAGGTGWPGIPDSNLVIIWELCCAQNTYLMIAAASQGSFAQDRPEVGAE